MNIAAVYQVVSDEVEGLRYNKTQWSRGTVLLKGSYSADGYISETFHKDLFVRHQP